MYLDKVGVIVKKKIIIISIVVLLLISLGVGLFFLFRETKPIVLITLKEDMTVAANSEVHVSDFIESINGKIKKDKLIDTSKLGKVKVQFEYVNEEDRDVKYFYEIEVVDKTAPLVRLSDSYYVENGSDRNFYSKVLCGDDYDSKPTCEVVGDYDTNVDGSYPLTFKATDKNGNVTEKPFTLYVYTPNGEGGDSNYSEPTYTYFSDVINYKKTDGIEVGLDISEWQGTPDYDKLKAAGVDFVFIRVGRTDWKTREPVIDDSFKYNIENANRVGIKVGVYFFSYANNKEQAIRDAKWIYKQIKDYDVELGVAFDWEDWEDFNLYGVSFYELTEMATVYLDYFKDKGYETLLYSSMSYLEEIWMKQNHPVWLAHYTYDLKDSSYKGDYIYWQLCSDGVVDGINGRVDINLRYKNK